MVDNVVASNYTARKAKMDNSAAENISPPVIYEYISDAFAYTIRCQNKALLRNSRHCEPHKQKSFALFPAR